MSATTRTREPRSDAADEPAPGPRRRAEGRLRTWTRVIVAGDRPFILAFVVLAAVAGLMLAGPVSRHLDSRDRVEGLEQRRDALHAEIDRLEGRVDDLEDPGHIELLAREQLGLVRPGEVPYVVVVPEQDRPQLTPAAPPQPEPRPWYRRLLDAVSDTFR